MLELNGKERERENYKWCKAVKGEPFIFVFTLTTCIHEAALLPGFPAKLSVSTNLQCLMSVLTTTYLDDCSVK